MSMHGWVGAEFVVPAGGGRRRRRQAAAAAATVSLTMRGGCAWHRRPVPCCRTQVAPKAAAGPGTARVVRQLAAGAPPAPVAVAQDSELLPDAAESNECRNGSPCACLPKCRTLIGPTGPLSLADHQSSRSHTPWISWRHSRASAAGVAGPPASPRRRAAIRESTRLEELLQSLTRALWTPRLQPCRARQGWVPQARAWCRVAASLLKLECRPGN